jgi:sulfite reductase beta subunit-like hemoprotein
VGGWARRTQAHRLQAIRRQAVREPTSAECGPNHSLRGKVFLDGLQADRGSLYSRKVLRSLQEALEGAYEAGYKTRARKAASEMRNPKYFPLVVKYIGELRAEVREKYGITFEKHVTELAQIRNEALKNKAWSAAVNAEVARGKAGGLYVDQKLVMTGNIDNLSTDEIKDKLKKILDDNKEIINITPEDIELDKLELQEESNLDSHSQKN